MASAADLLAKRNKQAGQVVKQADTSKPATTVLPAAATTWTPAPRVCSYTSRAINAEIFLGNNTSFKFDGNYYTTSKSIEIHELDSLCKRQPNVFTKIK